MFRPFRICRGASIPVVFLLLSLWLLPGCVRQAAPARSAPLSWAALPFRLEEVSTARGLTFCHTYGSRAPINIIEALGSGCAFFDFDNDGWLDIFLVNAGQDYQKALQKPASKLYRNTGDGRFVDVTAQSGIVIDCYAMGCCVGDYDNDGFVDLFVSGYAGNRLFHNLGGGRFRDVTKEAGILHRDGAWGMGCAFLDVNRDGMLDLYVANYIRYDPRLPLCETNGIQHGCTPNEYPTQPNELYINQGDGRFREMAATLGAEDESGAGLGVVVCDFDNDGWPDIFVANDGTPNALLHNRKGRFVNIGQISGVAYSDAGGMRAGMGTDAGDYDGDGQYDIVITNFQHEPNSLYRNLGNRLFEETTFPSGIGTPSMGRLGFGVVFIDLDGDGWLDLYVGNGHVFDNVHQFDDTATFEQVDQILLNQRNGQFKEVPPSSGVYPAAPSVARSVAVGDFNNDGAADLLINSLGRPVRLLENHPRQPPSWIGLKLEGTRSNRSAIGARVELRGPGGLQTREVRSGGSYLAQHDLRILFHLGTINDPTGLSLTIRWPSGKKQSYRPSALNRYETVREPK